MSPADWLRFLTELADRADELALRWFRTAGLRVQEKPDLSPVTEADQAIEAGGEVVAGVASAPALGARWHAARGSGAFRDGQRMTVSRIASLERAMLFHGNLGPGEGGPPPGIAGLIARVERTRGFGDFYQ